MKNSYRSEVTIKSGDNTTIYKNGQSYDFINGNTGTNGNDLIWGTGYAVSINALDGNDIIYAGSGENTIYGGAGHDSIHSGSSDNLILGESGNDSFYNYGSDNTIVGGTGDDVIEERGQHTLIKYSLGDGNDSIYLVNDISDSTVKVDSGNIGDISLNGSKYFLGSVSVKVGNGSLTFNPNGYSNSSFFAISKTDNIIKLDNKCYDYGWPDGTFQETLRAFTGTDNADFIVSDVYNLRSRYNDYNDYVLPTIEAGDGDDTITNYGIVGVIDAGDGNDSIGGSMNRYYSYNHRWHR